MPEQDWHIVLKYLPIWNGWSVDGSDGSLRKARSPVFAPNPEKRMPTVTKNGETGKIKYWRIESEFDRTVTDSSFKRWGAETAFEPYVWKYKLLETKTHLSRESISRTTDTTSGGYQAFVAKKMIAHVDLDILGNQFAHLAPDCETRLKSIQSCTDNDLCREILYRFIEIYGEWYTPVVTLGGQVSQEYSADKLTGRTMAEKERELAAGISGGALAFSMDLPFISGTTSTITDNQSVLIDRSKVSIAGGSRQARNMQDWVNSLNDPKTWAVIEREKPEPLFKIISQLSGWEWVRSMVEDIADSAPVPKALPSPARGRYFSGETAIATAVASDIKVTFVVFQDHNGWLRWGLYQSDEDEDIIFAEPIVQAHKASPLAVCAYRLAQSTNNWEVHVFYVNTVGILADIKCTIEADLSATITNWSAGGLLLLHIDINPLSRLAASHSGGESGELILIYENTLSELSSRLAGAVLGENKKGTSLSRADHQIEVVPRGLLSVCHTGNERKYYFTFQTQTSSDLVNLLIDPEVPNPERQVLFQASDLWLKYQARKYESRTSINLGINQHIPGPWFHAAVQDHNNMVDILICQHNEKGL